MKTSTAPTKKQKVNFARRFSFDDWTMLCQSQRFCDAIDAGEFEIAEVIASRILWSENPQAEIRSIDAEQ